MGKRVAYCAVFIALSIIFSYVELLIPFNFGIPGIKLGLANIVIVTGLYCMNTKDVFIICILRIFISGILFGNLMSILYSLSGGILSFAVMLVLKNLKSFSIIGVSAAGGTAHNIGQLLVAALAVSNFKIMLYLPVLLISGMFTGILIGILCKYILPVINSQIQY